MESNNKNSNKQQANSLLNRQIISKKDQTAGAKPEALKQSTVKISNNIVSDSNPYLGLRNERTEAVVQEIVNTQPLSHGEVPKFEARPEPVPLTPQELEQLNEQHRKKPTEKPVEKAIEQQPKEEVSKKKDYTSPLPDVPVTPVQHQKTQGYDDIDLSKLPKLESEAPKVESWNGMFETPEEVKNMPKQEQKSQQSGMDVLNQIDAQTSEEEKKNVKKELESANRGMNNLQSLLDDLDDEGGKDLGMG